LTLALMSEICVAAAQHKFVMASPMANLAMAEGFRRPLEGCSAKHNNHGSSSSSSSSSGKTVRKQQLMWDTLHTAAVCHSQRLSARHTASLLGMRNCKPQYDSRPCPCAPAPRWMWQCL
jgi:hypothetical protein